MTQNMKKYILMCVCIICSCQSSTNVAPLLSFALQTNIKNTKLSNFLGHYRIIPLELNTESIIGRVNKIVKRNDIFYILSDDKRIHAFDTNGRFLFVLDKLGKGPEEYVYIGDFDIYLNDRDAEIWLCDYNSIKIYDGTNGDYLRTINFDFVVNKFVKIDNKILLLTGQNDYVLTLTNMTGKIQKTFLKKEYYNIMFQSVQFIPYKNDYIYQIGLSNTCVKYNRENETFEEMLLFSGRKDILTIDICHDLFKKYEIDFLRKISDYVVLRDIHFSNHKAIVIFNNQKNKYISRIDSEHSMTIQYFPESEITNDITHAEQMDFIYAIGIGDSDDSLLSFVEAHELLDKKGIISDSRTSKQLPPVAEEDNPLLIEWLNVDIDKAQE